MFLNYIKEFSVKKIKKTVCKMLKAIGFWNNQNSWSSYRSTSFFRNKSFINELIANGILEEI
jgi:hypothetical protein